MATRYKDIVLPIGYPELTCITSTATTLAILAGSDTGIAWELNHFVQLRAYDQGHRLALKFEREAELWRSELFRTHSIPHWVMERAWRDVIDFVSDSIGAGYYVRLFANRFHMPPSDDYNRRSFFHPTLVYGTACERTVFKVADFYAGNKFSFESVPSPCLLRGYEDTEKLAPKRRELVLISCRTDLDPPFDGYLFRRLLADYINGRNTVSGYDGSRDDCLYGVRYLELLSARVDELLGKDRNGIRELLNTLWEHKKGLIRRFQYARARDVMPVSDSLMRVLEDLAEGASRLLMSYLRFLRSGEEWKPGRFDALIGSLRESESRFCQTVGAAIKE